MDDVSLALIGLQRLKLPIPMAKLQIVHGAARALLDPKTDAATWEALLKWVSSLKLESEVPEVLCAVFLARNSKVICPESLRSSIRCPSILSDIFIGEALQTRILYNSWAKSHSGEAPPLYRADNIRKELMEGTIVPPILGDRLTNLEEISGKQMIKQWTYEFDILLNRHQHPSDGQWSYFIEDERERAIGQVIGRRSHIARSAYLRTLALAFDVWDMPEDVARSAAMYASPADFAFLKMLPSDVPNWAVPFHQAQPNSHEEWDDAFSAIAQATAEQDDVRLLLHLNAPAQQNKRYQAEGEVITMLFRGEKPSTEEVFRIHDCLPGGTYITRSSDHNFVINDRPPNEFIRLYKGTMVLPELLPSVGPFVGYMHSDLMGRMPYLPANYNSDVSFIGRPCEYGADLELDGKIVGQFRYWNWRWSPTHDRALGSNGAVAVTVSRDSVTELIYGSKMEYIRVWRAKVLTREANYGEWDEVNHYGTLPF